MKLKISLIMVLALIITNLPVIASSFSQINFQNKEEMFLQISHSGGSVGTRISTIYDKGKSYTIKTVEEDGSVTKLALDKVTLKPLSFKQTDKKGKTVQYTKYYNNNEMYLAIPAEELEKMINIPDNAYDMHSLNYVFRSFPFEKENIDINLVMHDPGNIRNVRMSVKNLGIEKVKVLSGEFECYKLEMGCANAIERLFWPHKYYFWYTAKAPHYFVKFEGRDIDMSIVTNELLSYKVGKEFLVRIPSSHYTSH